MTDVSRRTVLSGAAAVAVGTIGAALPAQGDPLVDFLDLSAALTGIKSGSLKPNVDALDVKSQYFARASLHPAFGNLLAFYIKNKIGKTDVEQRQVVKQIMANAEFAHLAQSIILAWYLGAWYEPDTLKAPPQQGPLPYTVVSPTAYTQGWVWRVAQTHPMGYSTLQFGYWENEPPKPAFDVSSFKIAEQL